MILEHLEESNYPYNCAGRVWVLPLFRLTKLPDGTVTVSGAELQRVHRAIANEICGAERLLTPDELEFLTGFTGTTYREVAQVLDISPSALSKWAERGNDMPLLRSAFLKRWFWLRIFGDELSGTTVGLDRLRDDYDLLQFMHDQAIASDLVSEVHEKVA